MIKEIFKKIGLFCIIITMLAGVNEQVVHAELVGPDVCGEGYCVLNWNTGEVVLSKNKDEKMYPASITKVLTALVVLEKVSDLNEVVTFSEYAIQSLTSNSSTLEPVAQIGEQMTVRDALHGMLLISGNECATALAEHVAGSEAAFAQMMNQKAQEIGAKNSHFVNAHGLHNEEHYTTPYDIALIFCAALRNPRFSEIIQTINYTIPATNMTGARELLMGHSMVNGTDPYEGVFAGKTGRTYYAGRTLLTACKRGEHTLVTSLMKSDDYKFYSDEKIILEYAFGQVEKTMATPFQWNETEEQIWATGNVAIREFPSVYATIMGTFAKGTSLTRLGTYEGWSMVQCKSGIYYVGSAYVTTTEPEDSSDVEPSTEETTEEVTSSEVVESTPEETTVEPSTEETIDDDNKGLADFDWKNFLKKNWVYVLDVVVGIGIIIFIITKIRAKRSRRYRRTPEMKFKRKKRKW